MPSDYRLSPRLAARLLGAGLAVVGVLVCLVTVVIAVLQLPSGALAVVGAVVVLALGACVAAGLLVIRHSYVVRLGEEGYQVRYVRGAGVMAARWRDVEDAVTAEIAGAPCVVLRLKDGRTTTISVEALAGQRSAFVRDVQAHLTRFGVDRGGR